MRRHFSYVWSIRSLLAEPKVQAKNLTESERETKREGENESASEINFDGEYEPREVSKANERKSRKKKKRNRIVYCL